MEIDLVQDALDAIDEVFSDTTVDQETTLERMEEIKAHVQSNIVALREDMQ